MADDELQGTTAPDGAEGADTPVEADGDTAAAPAKKTAAKRAPRKKAPPKDPTPTDDPPAADDVEGEPATKAPAKKAAAKRAPAKKAAAKKTAASRPAEAETQNADPSPEAAQTTEELRATDVLFQVPQTTATKAPARRRTTTKVAAAAPDQADETDQADLAGVPEPVESTEPSETDETAAPAKKKSGAKGSGKSGKGGKSAKGGKSGKKQASDETDQTDEVAEADAETDLDTDDVTPEPEVAAVTVEESETETGEADSHDTESADDTDDDSDDDTAGGEGRRRRRRGGRRRRRGSGGGGNGGSGGSGSESGTSADGTDDGDQDSQGPRGADDSGDSGDDDGASEGTTRRRRRRRREGDGEGGTQDDPSNTVTRVRRGRTAEDEITSISGSTRLEAKKQRRRDGREAGRRRAPIVTEAEFLARRESVDRVMTIRQRDDVTQIGVLEDKVLVEHYVARESQTSMIGNVYLGRVQNVLPSMEAAFIDVGRGRNAVLYAGEVNWQSLGHKEGSPRKIESVLSSGQTILVQVTKDPIGHKGARLTSQVSLPGRFLVYVPDGTTSGISRKLPDTERSRLKTLLKQIVPDTAGVIVRTAAEGASEDELTTDVERLKARWEDIEAKVKRGSSPQLLYGEPDLTLKVVRDLFTEDFASLVIQGDDAWETVQQYVAHVAPDLEERLTRYDPADHDGRDLFTSHRVDEQIAKAMDRKVFLPSGGSLVIDRTEAMTVVDVNTGKFTGSGGNLEETVTKNNLEAAEEVVRQLRLRDIGGIIVVDFIDMVLESNRDLVLRRLVECLGRDRTRHQVAEVTSLGLVQMTRKRIGTGLLESFSENCEHCAGRGVVVHDAPVEPRTSGDDDGRRGGGGNGGGSGGRRRGGRGRTEGEDRSRQDDGGAHRGQKGSGSNGGSNGGSGNGHNRPTPAEFAAMAAAKHQETESSSEATPVEAVPVEPAPVEPAPVGSAEVSTTTEAPQQTPEVPEAPEAEPAPVSTEPRVSTRTRRGASRPAVTPETTTSLPPAAAPETDEVPRSDASTSEATPEATPAAEAPTGPRLVTRTRRGASRPAETAAPAPVSAPETSATTAVAEPPAAPAPAAPVAPPKVVTRTRGRSASRVAGPPAEDAPGDPGQD